MVIDWFTVIAQAINFLILVWLLKRFLYKPVLKAIDEREEKIKSRMNDAESKKEQADEELKKFKKKKEELDEQKDEILKEARNNAEKERKKIMEDARDDYERLKKKLEENLVSNKEKFQKLIKKETEKEVFNITRAAMKDLADSSIEEQMIRKFLKKLLAIDEERKHKIIDLISERDDNAITVVSNFEVDDDGKNMIREKLTELFTNDLNVRFITDTELIAGIELHFHEYKIGWNIENYLIAIEKKVSVLIDNESGIQKVKSESSNENG